MRFSGISPLLFLAAGAVQAASSWSFDDASVAVTSKKGGEATKESFGPKSSLTAPVTLGAQETLVVTLTAKDNGKAKRPHQAFLLLKEQTTGLEAPFPLSVRDNGKGKVQISQKDIPAQFFSSVEPLHASVVIGSFGSAQPVLADAFDLKLKQDGATAPPAVQAPLRYGKMPQIHHIFREPTAYPSKIFPYTFMLAIGGSLFAVSFLWFGLLGANFSHLSKALSAAPLSHATFFGSIFGIEFVYYLYHRGLTLGHILVPAAILSTTAVLSGMKALGEVQSRRVAGER